MCIFTSTVHIIDVESKAHPLVGIDGKIGFKAFFSVAAASLFIVGQVDKRRFGIGISHILWLENCIIVWVKEKELAGIFAVEEDMRNTRRT